jgi:hypothetical protein
LDLAAVSGLTGALWRQGAPPWLRVFIE